MARTSIIQGDIKRNRVAVHHWLWRQPTNRRTQVFLPRRIVDESQLAEIVSVLECCDDALAVDNDVDGTFEDDVPRCTLVSLIKHCKYRTAGKDSNEGRPSE